MEYKQQNNTAPLSREEEKRTDGCGTEQMSDVEYWSEGCGVRTRTQRRKLKTTACEGTCKAESSGKKQEVNELITSNTEVYKSRKENVEKTQGAEGRGEDMENTQLRDLITLLTAKYSQEAEMNESVNAEELIPHFTGEAGASVSKWFKNFDSIATANKWTDTKKIVFARSKMTKTAKLYEQQVAVNDYGLFKMQMISEFSHSVSSIEVHNQLRERKKKDSESVHEYVLHMRSIGSAGAVDEKSIIQYIADGIRGRPENKLTLYGARNYAELRENIEVYERINKTKYTRTNYNKNVEQKREHCFNCGSTEHKRRECTERQKCFRCNLPGHMSRQCTNEQVDRATKQVNCTAKINKLKRTRIDNKNFECLIDGGAEVSLIKESKYKEHFEEKQIEKCNVNMVGFGGATTKAKGKFLSTVELDRVKMKHYFVIVPDYAVNYDVVIGYDILGKCRYTSDENGYNFFSIISETELDERDIMNISVGNDTLNFEKEIERLKDNYKPSNIKQSPIEMKILLEKEEPVYASPGRKTPEDAKIITKQIEEWLKGGIIRKSTSQYCSRVVLVDKRDGTKRVCVDYRRLNKLVFKDQYPIPNMEDIVDNLSEALIFSTLDIESAFLHVPIEEDSRKYTAFITQDGLFEFNFAPFGYRNSPANFIRYIHCILRQLIKDGILAIYMDDIIIFAKTKEENLLKLEMFFAVAAEFGLRINWRKCKFLQTKVQFLGLIIEGGTIKPSDEKIKAVKNFPTPTNIRAVQSLLGLFGFFRKFVQGYSIVARPLTNLLRKDSKFVVGEKEKMAIQQLKQALTNQPVLRIFSRKLRTELHTDASKDGFGAILMQEYEENLHPVYFWSKKTSDAEAKLHSYVLETKAAFLAMKKLRHYLLGIEFDLITDCSAYKYTTTKEEVSPSVSRYIMYMQDFNFTVKHRNGTHMRHVDALSRYAILTVSTKDELRLRLEKAQQGDEYLKAIMDILETRQYMDYKKIGNVLFKESDGQDLLVVPRMMEKEVIKEVHDQGHFGVSKTSHQIKQLYFISHLEHKVDKIIKNCVKCILFNKKQGKLEGFLHIIDKGDVPLHTLHVDHLGPMDATTKKYKHIFAVVDGFSKFVWLYPTKSTGVDEVLAKIEQWCKVFGNPARIVSDKGPAFTSNAFAEFCKKEKIDHVQITTGVPRGNGQIERVNRTILSVISKLSWGSPEKWYRFVEDVQRAINKAVHRTTKYSPFQVLFGVKMRDNPIDDSVIKTIEDELIENFNDERNTIRQEAKQHIQEVQAEYKKTFDKKRKHDLGYKVNDLVAIKRTQFLAGRKLANEYLGPYEVTKIKRNGRYDVRKAGNFEGPNNTSTSGDFMKLWRYAEVEDDLSSGSDSESDGRM